MHVVYKIHKMHARVYREKQAAVPHVFSVEAVVTLCVSPCIYFMHTQAVKRFLNIKQIFLFKKKLKLVHR